MLCRCCCHCGYCCCRCAAPEATVSAVTTAVAAMVMNEHERIALEILKRRRATRSRRSSRTRTSTPETAPPEPTPPPEAVPSEPTRTPPNEGASEDHESSNDREQSTQPPPPPNHVEPGLVNILVRRRISHPTTLNACRQRADFIILGTLLAVYISLAIAVVVLLLPTSADTRGMFLPSTSKSEPTTRPNADTTPITLTTTTSPGAPTAASALPPPPPPVRGFKEVSIGDYECHDAGTFYLCNNARDGSCILIFGSFPSSRRFGVVPLDVGPKILSDGTEKRFRRYCRIPALWYRPA